MSLDQIERLINAVKDVSRKLTRLSTYEHIYALGGGLANTVSSVIGSMAVKYFVGGAAMSSTGGATGSLSVANQLEGSIAGQSGVVDNEMDISNQFAGSVAAQSNVANVSDLDSTTPMVFIAGISSTITITGGAHLEV